MIYEVKKLSSVLYVIKEDLTNNRFPIFIYLVIGQEKAALIDTGLGTDNLKALVRQITDLPILVLHTHGHLDHVGADAQFNELYVSPLETKERGADFDLTTQERLNFIAPGLKKRPEMLEYITQHMVPSVRNLYEPLEDGKLFDLGSLHLETVGTPGHTLGSVSFVCQEEPIAFTGDGIADMHWFDLDQEVTVADFLQTLEHFEARAAHVSSIYAAHVPAPFDLSLIEDLKAAAQEILKGSKDQIENADYQFLKHGQMYVHRKGFATLYYLKETVRGHVGIR